MQRTYCKTKQDDLQWWEEDTVYLSFRAHYKYKPIPQANICYICIYIVYLLQYPLQNFFYSTRISVIAYAKIIFHNLLARVIKIIKQMANSEL